MVTDGSLMLVNKLHPLPKDFVPRDLVIPQVTFFSCAEDHPRKQLQRAAATALESLFLLALDAGLHLEAASGYRSYPTQCTIFASHVARMGEKAANRESARPGESEHQTGLAMDVTSPEVDHQLTQAFGETREGRWLARYAPACGFILRYPREKEHITGYIYEPWHLRYVGTQHAFHITDREVTLEEYLDQIKSAPS